MPICSARISSSATSAASATGTPRASKSEVSFARVSLAGKNGIADWSGGVRWMGRAAYVRPAPRHLGVTANGPERRGRVEPEQLHLHLSVVDRPVRYIRPDVDSRPRPDRQIFLSQYERARSPQHVVDLFDAGMAAQLWLLSSGWDQHKARRHIPGRGDVTLEQDAHYPGVWRRRLPSGRVTALH